MNNIELMIKKFIIDKEQERNREFGNALKNISENQLKNILQNHG